MYKVFVLVRFSSGFKHFCSQALLYGNFHSLRYLYDFTQHTLGVSIRFCPESTFLSAKTYTFMVLTLRTKSHVWTPTYSVNHHLII